jgi:hypothetical protein
MDISVVRRTAAVLVCLFLFSTCGELETLFPSNGAYQVGTLVNGSSLEECSIIRSNDKVRPYFAVSVVNDPDLIGLLVYLQDSQGKIIGDKVRYTLLPYADENALTEEALQEETELNEADDPVLEDEAEKADDDEYKIPEQRTVADTRPVEKNTDIEIAVRSLAQELPYFPLPKDLEIGPYILVFEALGKKDSLSRMETNVFYVGSAEFNLKDISMYLPGLSGPQLISPGTMIMLETSLDYDSRLDPYVIWYNGKNVISEGKISDGAGKLLWKTPEQAGFYSLRLEALPFHLKRSAYTGFSREIALPVSPKAISLGHFFENNGEYTARSPLSAGTAYAAATAGEETSASYPAPELLQWYQFDGSLHSSLSTFTNEQILLPANEEALPRWAAAEQSYGLAIGPDDPYLLSPVNFFRAETDQGGGILLFHIRPLSEGIIFNAFFPLQTSLTEGVWMNVIKKGNVITLRLSAADASVDLPVYPAFSAGGFIPIAVEFYIRPYRLEAKISLDEYSQNKVGAIKLPGALSGEGRFRLGGSVIDNEAAASPSEETFPDTVWDELAILFSAAPLLQNESVETAAVYTVDAHEADRPAETNDADAKSAEADIPLTDTNDNPIQEPETHEREAQ